MRKPVIFFLSALAVTALLTTACGGKSAENKPAAGESIEPLKINVSYSGNDPAKVSEWKHIIKSYYDTILSGKLNGEFLIAKNGEILYEAYAGREWLHKDSAKAINEHSSLHLASVSKTFTAVAILKLQEKGLLGIDDEVSKYLAGFPYAGVTIKSLLNHRSGVPNYVHNLTNWGWPESKMASNNDMLQLLNTARPPLSFTPNTRFTYCNTNYALLALVIEKVTGKTYAEYLDKTIFKPLGMNDSYVFQPKDTLTAIPSYDWKGQLIPFNYLDGIYGDKNIYSTVRDLYKWDQALYTNAIISQQSLDAAYTPYSFEKPGVKNYGLGWRMYVFPNNKKIIFHNGWWHGNNNAFQRLIQDSATIICLGNRFARANYSVIQLSYLFGNYPFEIEQEEGNDSVEKDSLLLKTIRQRADSIQKADKLKGRAPKNKDTANRITDTMHLPPKGKKSKR